MLFFCESQAVSAVLWRQGSGFTTWSPWWRKATWVSAFNRPSVKLYFVFVENANKTSAGQDFVSQGELGWIQYYLCWSMILYNYIIITSTVNFVQCYLPMYIGVYSTLFYFLPLTFIFYYCYCFLLYYCPLAALANKFPGLWDNKWILILFLMIH